MAKNKKKSKKDKSQKEDFSSVKSGIFFKDDEFLRGDDVSADASSNEGAVSFANADSAGGDDFPADSEIPSVCGDVSADGEDSYASDDDFPADSETSSAGGNDFSTNSEGFPAAVIDASFFASAVLGGEDEKTATAQKFIQSIIERNGQFFVPQIFWFEIGNVLLSAAKKRKDDSPARVTTKQLSDIFMLISDLPFSTDFQPDSETRLRTLILAQSENLTYYDASYLELAQRHDIVLKTWDDALQVAATKE